MPNKVTSFQWRDYGHSRGYVWWRDKWVLVVRWRQQPPLVHTDCFLAARDWPRPQYMVLLHFAYGHVSIQHSLFNACRLTILTSLTTADITRHLVAIYHSSATLLQLTTWQSTMINSCCKPRQVLPSGIYCTTLYQNQIQAGAWWSTRHQEIKPIQCYICAYICDIVTYSTVQLVISTRPTLCRYSWQSNPSSTT